MLDETKKHDLSNICKEDEVEHLAFNAIRTQKGGMMEVDIDNYADVWPLDMIAVTETSTKGQLQRVQSSYSRITRCVGVFVCATCPHMKRPLTQQISKQITPPGSIGENKWQVCPTCSTMLDHISCPGTFKLSRKAGEEKFTIAVDIPCIKHPYPPKIRQTNREKIRIETAIQKGNKVSIVDRDSAGQSNNGLHQQRVTDIKKRISSRNMSVILIDVIDY